MTSSLSFPECSHPGLVVAPSPGSDFLGLVIWSLLAPWSWEPPSRSSPFSRSVTFWRLCGTSRSPPPPCFLSHCGTFRLLALRSVRCRISAGLASMDGPPLVSSVESQLCECPFVVLPRQLVGSGVSSPAPPICPTSSILWRSSFGISASGSASGLRDGVTLPGRACLNPRSERRLFAHLPLRSCRSLRTATGHGLAAFVLGVTGLDPRIDAVTAVGVTGRILRAASGCVVSVRIPQLVGRSG